MATRTWSATDACGNSNVCSQVVSVVDTTPPVIICASNQVVEFGNAWDFVAPTATDIADGQDLTFAVLDTVTNSTCGRTFVATRTWSATDACGNSNVCSQVVSVVDTTPPVITCASNQVVEFGNAWDFVAPTATDIADGQDLTFAVLDTVTNSTCGRTFVATRTWSATDACGNSNVCSQIVSVVDTTPPVIICASNQVVEFGNAWDFVAPTATDIADGQDLTFAVLDTVTNSTCGRTFVATRTWSATDACGNSNVCSQVVSVVDTTPPVIICASNQVVEFGNAWDFVAPTATDIADGQDLTFAVLDTVTNSTCGRTFVATRTWSATDACGNSNVCSQVVSVVDTTPPVIICASNQVVEFGNAWDFVAPTATDIADGQDLTFAVLDTVTNSTCGRTFVATRTWSATDACGNSNVCSQVVSVVDTTPPVIICASNQVVEFGNAWDFVAPTATDIADGQDLTFAVLDTVTNSTCGRTFVATRTWSATDACGNSNVCSQVVSVVDTTPPRSFAPPTRSSSAVTPGPSPHPRLSIRPMKQT